MLDFNTIPTDLSWSLATMHMLALAAFALGCNAPALPTAAFKAPTTFLFSQ